MDNIVGLSTQASRPGSCADGGARGRADDDDGFKSASPGSRDIGSYTFFTPSKELKLDELPTVLPSAWTTNDLDEVRENEDQGEESESTLD